MKILNNRIEAKRQRYYNDFEVKLDGEWCIGEIMDEDNVIEIDVYGGPLKYRLIKHELNQKNIPFETNEEESNQLKWVVRIPLVYIKFPDDE